MNVLLSSAGRRNYLVGYFKEVLNGRGSVFATDADSHAAALRVADLGFVVPPFTKADYIDHLLGLCVEHGVRLIVPLNDLELPLLAQHRDAFEKAGVRILVSGSQLIDVCLDKWRTYRFLEDAGVDTPRTFVSLSEVHEALSDGQIRFPVVVKPRWGTGSLGIEIVHSVEEMEWAYSLVKFRIRRTILSDISRQDSERDVIIQEAVTGQEFGLDIINDLHGNYVTTFVKHKLSMRAGETDKAITIDDQVLRSLGEKIGCLTQHTGIMDCDVLVDHSGRAAVLELNPRFGGGYPFSHMAGANVPAAIVAWMDGEAPNPAWLTVKPNVASAKYDVLTLVGDAERTS